MPVDMVEERWPQLSGIALPARNVVLFSEDDWILAYAFPPGETLAGEGFLPRAVGRFGEPRRVWTLPRDLAPNGHGDYWRDDRAAAEVGRLLGGAVPTAPAVAALAERALAEPVPLSMRSLATRELPARELQTS